MKNGMTTGFCIDATLQRPRYFPRQIMTPTELTLEQQFFLDKMRRHNRLLHGWGIVCGGRVRQAVDADGNPMPWTVKIESGYFLDPFGNEIILNSTVTYDLTKTSLNGEAATANGSDPWCSPVIKEPETDAPIYIGVRYEECAARPVRVHPVGCGCDDGDCEYSRTNESFVIAGLTSLPESYRNLGEQPVLDEFLRCAGPSPCPACPSDPWIILACITPADDGKLTIDCVTYGRYVVSFADYYLVCRQPDDSERVMELMERLRLHIDNDGMRILEEDHAGALGAVTALPVSALRGLSPGSDVGTRLQAVTVGEIAKMSAEAYEVFIEEKLAGITARGFQAKEFWVRAREVAYLTKEFRVTES